MGNDTLTPTTTGSMWKGITAALAALLVVAGGLYYVLQPVKPTGPTEPPEIGPAFPRAAGGSQLPGVRFTEITQPAGIRFRHTNGATDKKLLPETMGSGIAFVDFDRDGRQDILFVNSCYWPGQEAGKPAPTLALYRNKGNGAFEDVTAAAGLAAT